LRRDWLLKLPLKHTAPLWRQEGNYLLYKEEKNKESLEAYENALKSLDETPSLWGVTDPIQIYYGATVACVKLDLIDKAKSFFQEFQAMYESYSDTDSLKNDIIRYDEGVKWIKKYI
jgi:hypothetical protein